MATKLWDKGFEPDKMIEEYTVGDDRELDMRLAKYDVEGSLAHIAMLEKIGLLTSAELEELTAGLKEIAAEIEAGRFAIEPDTEDVHSQVELMLTRRLGDAGKKIHSGRSRNDQVLVDLKLFLRDELRQTADAVKTLFDRLQGLSEQYKEVLMPGYTHLQIAMPSSFGLWFGAYAETLADDMRLVAAAWHIANQNPLGSAAGYGSSFPLDREMTTRLLGFEALHYNVVAAQMSRGKSERAAANAQSAERERVQTEPVAAAPRVKGTPERLRRNIFLGRANRDGIFLRAEREVNLDQSLFRLVSNDGVTGTFTVIEEPEVEARIMADPDGTLAYSCILTDRDTFGRESVVTERPGTAVFESGRWRVLRKAQVKLV